MSCDQTGCQRVRQRTEEGVEGGRRRWDGSLTNARTIHVSYVVKCDGSNEYHAMVSCMIFHALSFSPLSESKSFFAVSKEGMVWQKRKTKSLLLFFLGPESSPGDIRSYTLFQRRGLVRPQHPPFLFLLGIVLESFRFRLLLNELGTAPGLDVADPE